MSTLLIKILDTPLHSCSFHWNVFYYLSTFFLLKFYVNLWLQATALALHWGRLSHGTTVWCVALLPGLCLLLGYHYDYAIHGSLYTSAHILFENTLLQHKMAKISCMALCCQNRVSKGTNHRYQLHVSACISVHSALVMVLDLLKKKKEFVKYKMAFCHFQVSYLKHSNGSYKWLR